MITRRERLRQATIDEIKTIAWDLMQTGPITINKITQEMGMTAPAFYGYFKSRDQLMEQLVLDSLDSFHKALQEAMDSGPSDISQQLINTLLGYREWAVANPVAFGLFAGKKVSGIDPASQSFSEKTEIGYRIFFNLFDRAWQKSLITIPQTLVLPLAYKQHLLKIKNNLGISFPEEMIHSIIQIMALIHGLISMELSSRFGHMIEDSANIFKFQVITALAQMGLSNATIKKINKKN